MTTRPNRLLHFQQLHAAYWDSTSMTNLDYHSRPVFSDVKWLSKRWDMRCDRCWFLCRCSYKVGWFPPFPSTHLAQTGSPCGGRAWKGPCSLSLHHSTSPWKIIIHISRVEWTFSKLLMGFHPKDLSTSGLLMYFPHPLYMWITNFLRERLIQTVTDGFT